MGPGVGSGVCSADGKHRRNIRWLSSPYEGDHLRVTTCNMPSLTVGPTNPLLDSSRNSDQASDGCKADLENDRCCGFLHHKLIPGSLTRVII